MKEVSFKGKKYNLNDENCYKCKADCGLNYCIDVCDDKVERLPIEIKWKCSICGCINTSLDTVLEEEWVVCGRCYEENLVEVKNGKVIKVEY